MTANTIPEERVQLHKWIDKLSPSQLDLVYLLVAELLDKESDDTEYLLRSEKMRERLLSARRSEDNIPFEDVREKLGI